MRRAESPPSRPGDLPSPTREDLDFPDPPEYLKNPFTKVFWCLSKRVRDKVMQNRPRPVFFCFHKGFCTFQTGQDNNQSKQMIEAHFAKRPNHKITIQELHGWQQLANERKRLRDDLRRREGGRRDSHPRMGGRGGSPREGSSHQRQRSPPGFRERSRSPILYPRQMSREGRSRSPGWRGSRSPPWAARSRSSERQSPPRRSHDRRGLHRRSPDRRSPPRWSPDRRGSPLGRRIQSPERRGPSLERRGSSEARRLSPLGGARLHPSPPQRSRSREREWSRQQQGGGWSRGGHTRPPPNNYSRGQGRTYNSRPGPGPGRFNSQLDPRHAERPVEQRTEDYVCRDTGTMKGCGMLFTSQELYAQHIQQRNMRRGCPPVHMPGPHPEVVLDDSHEDILEDLSPPASPPPLPASPPPPSFTGKVRDDGVVEFLGPEALQPGSAPLPPEPASTSLKGPSGSKPGFKPGAYPSVQRDASPPLAPPPAPAYPSVQRSPSPENLVSSPAPTPSEQNSTFLSSSPKAIKVIPTEFPTLKSPPKDPRRPLPPRPLLPAPPLDIPSLEFAVGPRRPSAVESLPSPRPPSSPRDPRDRSAASPSSFRPSTVPASLSPHPSPVRHPPSPVSPSLQRQNSNASMSKRDPRMRGKTPSPSNTTSTPVVPLPDLLAQKPAAVSHPEQQEILADDVVNAVHATLESTSATKKSKIKLPSCLTEPEQSAEEKKSAVLAAAKPNEDDLMELLLSKKSKVQATQRSASLDEGGGGEGKSRLQRTESTPSVGGSLDVRAEKAMSKGEKPSEKVAIPGEKVVAKKTGGRGEKMEITSKAVERQTSKVSDSFSKALGESDKMVSSKKAKKEKRSEVNEKQKKGTKGRVYTDTERARTSNPYSRNDVDPVKTGSEKSQKHNKVEKHKPAENVSKGQKISKGSLLADVDIVSKETDSSVASTGDTTPGEEEEDIGSDNIACQYCLVMFKFDNLQEHVEKCEKKKYGNSETGEEMLAGQVEAVEVSGGGQNVEVNSKKSEPVVVHSDEEPADEFAREGREKEERERCLKENETRTKEEKEAKEKLEREVKENEEKERKKKEKKEREDEKEKNKRGTEKELKRKEKKRKATELDRKEGGEKNDEEKILQEEKEKNEKEEKEASQQQEEIGHMDRSKEEKDRTEESPGKAQTGLGFGTTEDNKEKEMEMEGSDAQGQVLPEGDLSEDEEAQQIEGHTKRKGESFLHQKGQNKMRRMTRGEVMSLHKALGGSTSSEEEELEEEPLSIWKDGDIDRCPRCSISLQVSREQLTLNVTDLSILLDCTECGVRLRLRGFLGDHQLALLSCPR